MVTSQGTARVAGSHQKLGDRLGVDSPTEPQKEPGPADTEFGLLASKVVREYVSFLLSPKVSDNLLWQPQETTTVGKYERFFFLVLQILIDH